MLSVGFRGSRAKRNWSCCLGCVCLATACLAILAGCGVPVGMEFPDRLVGADGQRYTIEDLERIAQNDSLSSVQKEEMFRDLGVEDERLIAALLEL